MSTYTDKQLCQKPRAHCLVQTKNGKINKRKNCHGKNDPLADINLAYRMEYNDKPYDALEYVFDPDDQKSCVNFDTAWLTHIQSAVEQFDDLKKKFISVKPPISTDAKKDLEQLNQVIAANENNFDPMDYLEEIHDSLRKRWLAETQNTSSTTDDFMKKKKELLERFSEIISKLKDDFPSGVNQEMKTTLSTVINDPNINTKYNEAINSIKPEDMDDLFNHIRKFINLGKYVVAPPTNTTEIDQLTELLNEFTGEKKGGSFKRKTKRKNNKKKRTKRRKQTRKMKGGGWKAALNVFLITVGIIASVAATVGTMGGALIGAFVVIGIVGIISTMAASVDDDNKTTNDEEYLNDEESLI